MDLTEQVNRMIEEQNLFEPGDRIVVAVSGGPDSTALLHLLFLLSERWGWQLAAAHANHGFRPEESAREAEFVAGLAGAWGIPFYYKELDIPSYLRRQGGNPQEVSRRLRYDFLVEAAGRWGARRIALAHHAHDQAETVLMRILRGTGISGLAGIPAKRMEQNVELIRPLLRINKAGLMNHLERSGIGYCLDSSNEAMKYTRNRLRLEAFPHLARYNPSLVEALNRLSGLAAADDNYMDREALRAFEELAVREGPQVRFGRTAYGALHVALQRRFLKLILNYLFLSEDSQDFRTVERLRSMLLESAKPNISAQVTREMRFIREYDEVRLIRQTEGSERVSYEYILSGPDGEIWIPEGNCKLIWRTEEARAGVMADMAPATACFDAGLLRFPLSVRSRREGDRLRVDGLNGSKKVKDIFIDDKVPASKRGKTPLIVDAEDELLVIPGVRRSDLAKVTEASSQVFLISCNPLS